MKKTITNIDKKKNYQQWFFLKNRLHNKIKNLPSFQEREIYWCHLGENIGFEEDGKDRLYLRPILVFRKFNHRLFYGIPLTSKPKDENSPFYYKIDLHNKITGKTDDNYLILSQMRNLDVKRLVRDPIEKISEKQYDRILEKFSKLFKQKFSPRG
jgi:hypothetical protein